jgi:hypothetical protein
MRFTKNSQICYFAYILNLVIKSILKSLHVSSYREATTLLNNIARKSWKKIQAPIAPIAKL